MTQIKTSRDIIHKSAMENGWTVYSSSKPLEDIYWKNSKKLVVLFDIIGRVRPGGHMNVPNGIEDIWVNNRDTALDVIEAKS